MRRKRNSPGRGGREDQGGRGGRGRPRVALACALAALFCAGSAPAQVVDPAICLVDAKSTPQFRVLCYEDRDFWEIAADSPTNAGRYYIDFNEFTKDVVFDDAPLSLPLGCLDDGRLCVFELSVLNGPACPSNNQSCLSNRVQIQVVNPPPGDPTIDGSPWARCFTDYDLGIDVVVTFDASFALVAFGADFASPNSGELLDMELVMSDGVSRVVAVDPATDPGFFGIVVDDFGAGLQIDAIRLVSNMGVAGTGNGEKFGMDNVGTRTACQDTFDNDADGDRDFAGARGFPPDLGCTDPGDLSEVEDCGDGIDNDEDGFTDFAGGDPGCLDALDQTELADCDDGFDNDGDGRIDAADPGCDDDLDDSEMSPDLVCDNGLDDDGDGLTDFGSAPGRDRGCNFLDDVPAMGDPLPFGSEWNNDVECDNEELGVSVDDDGDGFANFVWDPDANAPDPLLSDPGCSSEIDESEKPACDDGIDNDFDGCSDFADPEPPSSCRFPNADGGDPECRSPDDASEIIDCTDGVDNDGDGFTDFDGFGRSDPDPECISDQDAAEEPGCSDGLDNDADGCTDFDLGGVDCMDADGNPAGGDSGCTDPLDLTEVLDCIDLVDNDGDGLVDREALALDPGCEDLPEGDSSELDPDVACDNGIDDDFDGLTDANARVDLRDFGCEDVEDDSELWPEEDNVQCDDGIDNDGDGCTDYRGAGMPCGVGGNEFGGDSDCTSNIDLSESIACSDGVDNDGDGFTDFDGFPDPGTGTPNSLPDPGCDDGLDDDERRDCGLSDIDSDGDEVCDENDNCLLVFNPFQVDVDGDRVGNACDQDYNNDSKVGRADHRRLRMAFGTHFGEPGYNPAVDADCDGAIGALEYGLFRDQIAAAQGFPGLKGPAGCQVLGTGCPSAPTTCPLAAP